MSKRIIIPRGGLRHTPARLAVTSGPLRADDGADASWCPEWRPGDDQGNFGACTIFTWLAVSFLAESRGLIPVVDDARTLFDRTNAGALALYDVACQQWGRGDEGATHPESLDVCISAGWLPSSARIEEVGDLSALGTALHVCGVIVDNALDRVSDAGAMDESDPTPGRGQHSMPILAHGRVEGDPAGIHRVILGNHWTRGWGDRGMCFSTETCFRRICREIWRVRF